MLPQVDRSIVPSTLPPEWILTAHCFVPASRNFPISPSDSKTSSERGCTTVARSQCNGPGKASIKWHGTSRRCSSAASSNPVGPAPTTSTDPERSAESVTSLLPQLRNQASPTERAMSLLIICEVISSPREPLV